MYYVYTIILLIVFCINGYAQREVSKCKLTITNEYWEPIDYTLIGNQKKIESKNGKVNEPRSLLKGKTIEFLYSSIGNHTKIEDLYKLDHASFELSIDTMLNEMCTQKGKIIQLEEKKEPKKPKRVADAHYHVSLTSYNREALSYECKEINKKGMDSTIVNKKVGKEFVPLKANTDDLIWNTNLKKLNTNYLGRDKTRPCNIPMLCGKNSHLKNYNQASMPQAKEGNVKLVFNSISPIENNLLSDPVLRFFAILFKSKGDRKWFKKIGDWDELTHFENFKCEVAVTNAQMKLRDGFEWDFLERTDDPDSFKKMEENKKMIVINVLEGAHTLQDKYFKPKLQNPSNEISMNLAETPEDSTDRFRYNLLHLSNKDLSKAEVEFAINVDAVWEDDYKQEGLNVWRNQQKEMRGDKDLILHEQESKWETDYLLINGSSGQERMKERMEKNLGLTSKTLNTLRLKEKKKIYIEQQIIANIEAELHKNITYIKTMEPSIFMVTIGHLSYNGMHDNGAAIDANGLAGILLSRFWQTRVDEEMAKQWNKVYHAPPGLTRFGKLVINRLLAAEYNGVPEDRILIDLKHSGFTTRRIYLDYIEKLRSRDNKPVIIPPICSHCAVTGLSSIHYSPTANEYAYKDSRSTNTFYPFSINLYNEEIAKIFELDGIVGIPMEERVLGGYIKKGARRKAIKRAFKKRGIKKHKLLYKDYISIEPFLQNLFHMIDHSGKTINDVQKIEKSRNIYFDKSSVWKQLCMGSDYDGVIDPIDMAPTAAQYPYFRMRMKQFIPLFLELRGDENRQYDFYFDPGDDPGKGFVLDEALDMFFYESMREFVVKYFLNKKPGSK